MPGRTIAIGGVHGCPAALATLLGAIAPTAEDTLVTLGDYIDRGPDSRGVLDLLLDLNQRCRLVPLLGNHEEMLVAAVRSKSDFRFWLSCGGVQMLRSYGSSPTDHPSDVIPRRHWEFLAGCRNYFETDTHFVVHAGYVPDLPLSQQPGEVLRWQFVNPQKARPHYSGKVAIVGHTPQNSGEILDLGFLKCIDTACEPGKWLTALEVQTGQVWQADKHGRLRQ